MIKYIYIYIYKHRKCVNNISPSKILILNKIMQPPKLIPNNLLLLLTLLYNDLLPNNRRWLMNRR